MRFSVTSALFALVSAVVAQTGSEDPAFNIINAPAQGAEVAVGKTFTIQWALGSKAGSGTVKILLSGGKNAQTLQSKGSIASGVSNAALKYDWLVDAKFAGEDSYGIQIVDEATDSLWQWSKNFKIVGGASSDANTTSSSTTTTTTTASSTAVTTSRSTTLATTTSAASTSTTVKPSSSPVTNGTLPSGNGTSPSPTATIRPTAGAQGAAINAAALIGGLAIAFFTL